MAARGVRILRITVCSRARVRAMEAVAAAIKAGRLVNLKRKFVKCADCDRRATCYDHRRYSEPLSVEPVCKRHNNIRGPAEDQVYRDVITGEQRTAEEYRAERCRKIRVCDRIASAITGGSGYLRDGAVRADWRNMRVRARGRIAYEKRQAYLMAEHEYVLRVGGTDAGERRVMTGLEARRLNVANERAFIAQIQTDKTKRLQRWCIARREAA